MDNDYGDYHYYMISSLLTHYLYRNQEKNDSL